MQRRLGYRRIVASVCPFRRAGGDSMLIVIGYNYYYPLQYEHDYDYIV